MAFHAHSGWFFERLPEGVVRVFRQLPNEGTTAEVTFDPFTWASICATVSERGETSETYNEALRFHGEPKFDE